MKLAAIIVAFVFTGCGLFDTRDPENPINAGSTFEPAVTPTIVIRNLESALGANNASDYRKCFSDTVYQLPSFSFQPSAQGIAAAPSKFAEWGVLQEEQYFKNIVAELEQNTFCTLLFSPSEITSVPVGDSIQFTANYVAVFPHTRAGAERNAEGRLQFTLRMSPQNQQWYIVSWRDLGSTDNKTSWSLVKARFIDN